MFRGVRKVTGGLEATLRAYAVPDQTENAGGCLNRGYLHKMLVVEVDGRFRAVREPVIDCGAPLQSAADAYEAMTTEVVTSVRLSQVDSPPSVASGCPLQVKDTIARLPMMQGLPASPPPATLPVAEAVTACVYGANPGALVGSATVDPTCGTTPHTRFAVLEGSGLPWTEIALDGCGVDQGSGALRAPAELQTLLLAALTQRIVVG